MRTAAAALALGLTLTAAGVSSCAGSDDPVQPPEPGPEVTPVYASDEEALAAAEELYGRYLDIANSIGQSGWVDPSGFSEVARDAALEDELESAASYSERGYRQTGDIKFDSMALQRLDDRGPSSIFMTVYLCADVTDVDVLDREGASTISAGRVDRQPLELDIDDVDGALKVSRSDVWSGTDFC